MSVYVDRLTACIPSRQWPFAYCCHLLADDTMQLHAFARQLGLKREWYQARSVLPHYDLTAMKRRFALRLGAIPIEFKDVHARILAATKRLEENGAMNGTDGSRS